jgi:hypothetical protein
MRHRLQPAKHPTTHVTPASKKKSDHQDHRELEANRLQNGYPDKLFRHDPAAEVSASGVQADRSAECGRPVAESMVIRE